MSPTSTAASVYNNRRQQQLKHPSTLLDQRSQKGMHTGLTQLLFPGVAASEELSADEVWGMVSVAIGAGMGIVIAEVLEADRFFDSHISVRFAVTAVVTFISILVTTVLIRSVRDLLRALYKYYTHENQNGQSDQRPLDNA